MTWRDDAAHNVPTSLTVDTGAGPIAVAVPPATPVDGHTTATIAIPPFESERIMVTIDGTSDRTVPEYFSGAPRSLPIAISEFTIGTSTGPNTDTDSAAADRAFDSGCRTDLARLDGEPFGLRVFGSSSGVLDIETCGGPVEVGPGTHRLDVEPGRLTGIDLDRLVLDAASTTPTSATVRTTPKIVRSGSSTVDATLPATAAPAWLILPQSLNPGWTASIDGVDLGPPSLINGYANGWIVPAGSAGRAVELRWTPQRSVNVGLAISALFALLILALVAVGRLRRRAASATALDPAPIGSPFHVGGITTSVGLVAALFLVGGLSAAVSAAAVSALVVRAERSGAERALRVARRGASAAVFCAGWGLVSGLIIAFELRYDYADGPDWPGPIQLDEPRHLVRCCRDRGLRRP